MTNLKLSIKELEEGIIDACKFMVKVFNYDIIDRAYLDPFDRSCCPLSACVIQADEDLQRLITGYIDSNNWNDCIMPDALEDSEHPVLRNIDPLAFIEGWDYAGYWQDDDHPRDFNHYLLGRNLMDKWRLNRNIFGEEEV